MILKICPKCKSKNLSDGKSDFIYTEKEGEIGIQFCYDCHEEWYTNKLQSAGVGK